MSIKDLMKGAARTVMRNIAEKATVLEQTNTPRARAINPEPPPLPDGKKPRLHLLGLPHTITRPEYSHCAFTGKTLRFAPMIRSLGYEVIHYGNEGAQSGANAEVVVLSKREFEGFVGKHDPHSPAFVGAPADIGSELYRRYNAVLHAELGQRVEPWDIVCLPFGHAHEGALTSGPYVENIRQAHWVETGIGYPVTFTSFLVYESSAWLHWHHGKRGEHVGSNYRWVIPNYYDLDEWTPRFKPGEYYAYFGRLRDDKGLADIVALAKARPDLDIVICGQGDPKPYLKAARNIRYQRPLWGRQRCHFLANASAVFTMSRFLEPFCGVAVEAMLCGTPVIASPFGAMLETVQHGVTGFHCHTLGDMIAAADKVLELDRRAIRRHAEQYDMYRIAPRYDAVFQHVSDIPPPKKGWATTRARTAGLAPPVNGVALEGAALEFSCEEAEAPDSEEPWSEPEPEAPDSEEPRSEPKPDVVASAAKPWEPLY